MRNVGEGVFDADLSLALVAPEEGHKLRSRADGEGTESSVVKAGGDALLGRPKYRRVVWSKRTLGGDVAEIVYTALG